MAEVPGGVCIFNLFTGFVGFGDCNCCDDEESHCEYGHRDIEQQVNRADGGGFGNLADKHTHEQRGDGTGERVARAAHLHELVALVAATAQEVEHGVNDHVEHTYREAADECAKEVDIVVERDTEDSRIGAYLAREPLEYEADEADNHGPLSCALVADILKHFAGGNTHEQICQEVHEVADHARPVVIVFPDCTERSCEVRNERNHGKEQEHSDNRYPLAFCTAL